MKDTADGSAVYIILFEQEFDASDQHQQREDVHQELHAREVPIGSCVLRVQCTPPSTPSIILKFDDHHGVELTMMEYMHAHPCKNEPRDTTILPLLKFNPVILI
jgi:hypothetical protein